MNVPKSSMMLCLLLPLLGSATENGQPSQFSVPPDPFQDVPAATQPAVPTIQPTTPVPEANTPIGLKPDPVAAPTVTTINTSPDDPSASVLPAPSKPMSVKAFVDGVKAAARPNQLAIHAPKRLVVGEALQFSVSSPNDCYLTVLGFSPEGQQIILFPNQMQADPFLRGGDKVNIPPAHADVEFALQGKGGTQTLVALCSPEKKPLYQGGYRFNAQPFIELRPGSQIDTKLLLAQPLSALGVWAVADVAVKNYQIKYP